MLLRASVCVLLLQQISTAFSQARSAKQNCKPRRPGIYNRLARSSLCVLCSCSCVFNCADDDHSCEQQPKIGASKFGTCRAMAPSSINQAIVMDLPLELFTAVCLKLDLHDLVRVSETCKRFRHGEDGLETVELPTKSPVVTALREHAFSGGELIPSTRPTGCAESWVAYLARCVRQRCRREAPPLAAGDLRSLFLDAAGRLLTCGEGAAVGHGDEDAICTDPTPVTALAGVRVRSVAAGSRNSLALGWDGRVYSWGENRNGQLGQGDRLDKPAPALVEGLESVRGVAAAYDHSLAVTQSGAVFSWGHDLLSEAEDEDRRFGRGRFGVHRSFTPAGPRRGVWGSAHAPRVCR
jgi:hypothetical protein